jgi:hypothetical protein
LPWICETMLWIFVWVMMFEVWDLIF